MELPLGTWPELPPAGWDVRMMLPEDQFVFHLSLDGKHVVASFYEHPEGYRRYEMYPL